MSEPVSGRRDGSNLMVTTGPDVLLTPMGSGMVPVAYASVAFLDPADRLSTSVRNNALNDFQLNSRSGRMTGHEPGTGRGVVVPGYKSYSHVMTASSNVFSEGWAVVRDGDPAWMNHPDIGPTEPRRTMRSACAREIEAIENETDAITAIEDPIERNKEITAAYTQLAASDPDNRWIKLASIVSVQGGCAMKQVAGIRDHMPGFKDDLDGFTGISYTANMYQALGDANASIFGDIYPMAAYRARHGYERMKECYAREGKRIPPEIREAFEEMDKENGDLRRAADALADYEQREVVQPVYDRYSTLFGVTENVTAPIMAGWDAIKKRWSGETTWGEFFGGGTGDKPYEIPVSTSCGSGNVVKIDGSISDADARVRYYGSLMDELSRQQGWSW